MDEKMFNLMEKMYTEMQEMKENMATKQDLEKLESKVNQNLARLENKMDNNHKTLYDGYKQSIEGITDIRQKLDKLTDRVENQEIKLQVLKTAK